MIPSSPAAARSPGSSLARSGRAASIGTRASRPQPEKAARRKPGCAGASAIEQAREGDDPAEDAEQQEAVGHRQARGGAGAMLDQSELQIAQHARNDEGHRQE